MNLLICCTCFWKTDFPCLCWGLVVAIVILWSLYIVRPLIKAYFESKISILKEQHSHEKEMKEKAFEREIKWADRALTKEIVEKLKLSPDEWLKNQINILNENINKIADDLKSKKEKEEEVVKSLELRKKAYEEMIQHLSLMVSLENKPQKDKNQGK